MNIKVMNKPSGVKPKYIDAKLIAFSDESTPQNHMLMIQGDTVKVWDSVCNHYTGCHRISNADIQKILAKQ